MGLSALASAFQRSEFAIINTDNPDDLPIEDQMPIADSTGVKLNLRLHYERFPDVGDPFKVQVYAPYAIYNKSGLDMAVMAKASFSGPKATAPLNLPAGKLFNVMCSAPGRLILKSLVLLLVQAQAKTVQSGLPCTRSAQRTLEIALRSRLEAQSGPMWGVFKFCRLAKARWKRGTDHRYCIPL